MDILIGLLVTAALGLLTWFSLALGKHGRAGLMRIAAARLRARADGIDAGRAARRESLAFYMSELTAEKEKVTL